MYLQLVHLCYICALIFSTQNNNVLDIKLRFFWLIKMYFIFTNTLKG